MSSHAVLYPVRDILGVMAEEQEAGVLDELPDGRGHHGEAEGEPHRRGAGCAPAVALVLLEHIEHAQPDEGEHRPAQAVNSVVVPWNAAVQPQGHPRLKASRVKIISTISMR